MKTEREFRSLLFVILIIVVSISYLVNQSLTDNESEKHEEQRVQEGQETIPKSRIVPPVTQESRVTLTIDGYDPDTKSVIKRINLWNNYETRAGIVGQVSHGQKVKLIKRVGDGVLVETSTGLKGWLTYWFVKEYNK